MTFAGFVLVTVGIVTGSQWSLEAWGALWAWEPKSILAALTWMALAASLWSEPKSGSPTLRFDGPLFAAALLMGINLLAVWWLPSVNYSLHAHSEFGLERTRWQVPGETEETHAEQLQALLAQE